MLPGMERRLTEHMMVHQQASEIASGRSLQEVPLLKGSFGHHSATTGNSSSQESLYGASSSQQVVHFKKGTIFLFFIQH